MKRHVFSETKKNPSIQLIKCMHPCFDGHQHHYGEHDLVDDDVGSDNFLMYKNPYIVFGSTTWRIAMIFEKIERVRKFVVAL